MNSIFLFGSNGQLGLDIQKIFKNDNLFQIHAFTQKDINFSQLDRLEAFLEFQFSKLGHNQLKAIINCVALTNTSFCEQNIQNSFAINAFPLKVLAKFAQKYNIDLIHISTDYVFNGKNSSPYTEIDTPHPINIYGISKLSAEHLISSFHTNHFIFRSSSLFGIHGAQGKGGNFVETMIKLAAERPYVEVVDDQFMTPTHTLDLARVIHYFIKKQIKDYGIYNFSNNGLCSWFEFAQEIFKIGNIQTELRPTSWKKFPSSLSRPNYSVFDLTKIKKNYQPPSWQEALKEYFQIRNLPLSLQENRNREATL